MKARVIATGKIVEVREDYDLSKSLIVVYYTNIDDPREVLAYWTDEMIEGLAEEEKVNHAWTPQVVKLDETLKNESLEITLSEGYEFKDENGNVINAKKIVLEKKKPRYPNSYEKCRAVLGIKDRFLLTSYDLDLCYGHGLVFLQKLLICRDAYWKIAGEEMGLGKPWEPYANNNETKFAIVVTREGEIVKRSIFCHAFRYLLVFPTEEMCDAFYENFKEPIEQCKELL